MPKKRAPHAAYNSFILTMCFHSRMIYATCGHSTFSPRPLIECRHACIAPGVQWSISCMISAHPYKTLRVNTLCPPCHVQRASLLGDIQRSQVIHFDDARWRVSYASTGGADYWTKRAEDREQQVRKLGESPSRRKSLKRFSWWRSKRNTTHGDSTPTINEERAAGGKIRSLLQPTTQSLQPPWNTHVDTANYLSTEPSVIPPLD